MNNWFNLGDRVYIKSFSNWVKSGYTTIVRIEKGHFYLQRDPRIKVDITSLDGDFLDFHNICHIYRSKEDIKPSIDIFKKCKIITEKLHLLSEKEIDEIYNIVIKNK